MRRRDVAAKVAESPASSNISELGSGTAETTPEPVTEVRMKSPDAIAPAAFPM